MKQTAVEWLIDELRNKHGLSIDLYSEFDQAKEIEKEQMLDFCWTHSFMTFPDIEDKFNETFKQQEQ
jgi:hypothetical protein